MGASPLFIQASTTQKRPYIDGSFPAGILHVKLLARQQCGKRVGYGPLTRNQIHAIADGGHVLRG